MGPGLVAGAISGLLLAGVSSAGIVAERLSRGDARVVLGADAVAAAVAVIVLATTFRPFITTERDDDGAPRRSPARVIGAQAVGALAGVALVHLALRATSLRTCGWLCEEPRQIVNDLAAAFGALALVWGCARKPIGELASLGAVAIAAAYAITSSRWHLDAWRADVLHGAFRSISVQIAVLAQIACTAVGVAVFHRLRTSPPSFHAR
ncbi:Aquaporin Z [Minicystis rosea]|nr:Aquaporin Z [Minicystis rosea]